MTSFILVTPANQLPDSNHSLGQHWHFVGSFAGPTLTTDVGPMSFCSSGRLNCQRLVRCKSNALRPTCKPYICQRNANPRVGPTLARHDLRIPPIINLFLKFDFPYFVLLLSTIYSIGRLRIWHFFSIYSTELILNIKRTQCLTPDHMHLLYLVIYD